MGLQLRRESSGARFGLPRMLAAATGTIALVLVSFLVGVNAAGAAPASPPWQIIDTVTGAAIDSVSCPTTTSCFAVGGPSLVAFSNAPNTSTDYLPPSGVDGLTSIACPSVNTCLVAGFKTVQVNFMITYRQGVLLSASFSPTGPTWTTESIPIPTGDPVMPELTDVACPSTDACYVSTKPTIAAPMAAFLATADGGAHWTAQPLPSGVSQFGALACPQTPSNSTCYATDNVEHDLAVTTDGGATWSITPSPVTTAGINDVACPSATTCFVAADGYVFATTDSGALWTTQRVREGNELLGISCSSISNCETVGITIGSSGPTGFIAATSNGGAKWTSVTPPPAGQTYTINDVNCPGSAECFAVAPGSSSTYILATIPPVPLVITTASLPTATRGVPYSVQLQAVGGQAPYHWKKLSALPRGLRLSSGTISGTAKLKDSSGPYSITVSVRDSTKGTHQTATRNLTLNVA